MPIRVILGDDHAIFRQGLKNLFSPLGDIELVGEASHGDDALEIIRRQGPDVAVLDISMPAPDGIEIAAILAGEALPTRVLVLSMHGDPATVRRALDAGVAGYVPKNDAFDDLVYGLRTVAAGKRFLSPAVTTALVADEAAQGETHGLTPRETQVLGLVSKGLTNRQIAARLHVSVKTVDTHRTHVMQKLDLHNAAERVRFALERGLA